MYYMLYGIGMYWFMRVRKIAKAASMVTALAAVFSTTVLIWLMNGHHSKPIALMSLPYILIFLEKLKYRFSLLMFALLCYAVHVFTDSMHVQIVFYSIITLKVYLIAEIFAAKKAQEHVTGAMRNVALLAATGAFAFTLSGDRYLSLLEYQSSSIRGQLPIEKRITEEGKQKEAGLDYDYASSFSFSPSEMMTFLVPNYFGFGKMYYKGSLTNNREVKLYTYWGQKPISDAANYIGIGVMFLAFVGLWRYRSSPLIIALFSLSIFALLFSFGRNFPVVFDLFYYYVPGFNKFRAPEMILVMMQFTFPILAGYGVHSFLTATEEERAELKKIALGGVGFFGFWLILGFAFGAIGKQGYMDALRTSNLAQMYPEHAQSEIFGIIYSSMISDWYVTAIMGLLTAGMAWLYIQRKVSLTIFALALPLLVLTDLWRVDFRTGEISEKGIEEAEFSRTDVIQYLQQDNEPYRVIDLTRKTANYFSHFNVQSINGYHAAKLRVYQDMVDVAGKGGGSIIVNPFLWNLLSVRYILSPQQLQDGLQPVYQSRQEQTLVYRNPQQLPRLFFVDSVQVADEMTILEHLRDGDFNPQSVAYVEEALNETIEPTQVDALVKDYRFSTHEISATVNATGNNFLFFSEVWYKPAWKAYIDGKEVPVIKTNYTFRGIVVPKGEHTVSMRYESDNFSLGKTLTISSNGILIVMIALGFFLEKKRVEPSTQE
jgi:hypothetical protein